MQWEERETGCIQGLLLIHFSHPTNEYSNRGVRAYFLDVQHCQQNMAYFCG